MKELIPHADEPKERPEQITDEVIRLRRENARLRGAGKALRDALAFECHKIGDVPREIDEWDALVSALPNVKADS